MSQKTKQTKPTQMAAGAAVDATALKLEFLSKQNAEYASKITSLSRENSELKTKIEAILAEITLLMADLQFPTKITFWWALSNAGKLITFVKGIIDIIKNK